MLIIVIIQNKVRDADFSDSNYICLYLTMRFSWVFLCIVNVFDLISVLFLLRFSSLSPLPVTLQTFHLLLLSGPFRDVTECVPELRDKLETVLRDTWPRINATLDTLRYTNSYCYKLHSLPVML